MGAPMDQKRNFGIMHGFAMFILVFVTMFSVTVNAQSGLAGLWMFDETSGTTTADSSGNSNTGTLTSMPTDCWIKGLFINSLDFDGTGYVSVANSSSLQITGNLTISFWVKPDSIGPSRYSLIDKSYGGEFSLVLEPANAITFLHGKAKASGSYLGTTMLRNWFVSGEWQHVAITRNVSTRELKGYIDGELKETVTYSESSNYEPFVATTYPVKIGSGYLGGFAGSIDMVRIYNTELSALDIYKQAYEPAYVARWSFEDGSGTTAEDDSHYGNDGTLNNMTSPWQAGVDDGALEFDGSGYVSVANDSSLQLTKDLSISFWIKPDTMSSRTSLIDKSYGGEFSLVLEPVGGLTFYQGKAKVSGSYLGTTMLGGGIVTDEWQHIVVTRDVTTRELKAYLNGELKKEVTYAASSNYEPFAATTFAVIIGDGYQSGFDGLIDEVIITDYAFTDAEVQGLYNYADLRGYWEMSEGQDVNVFDLSGHGNHASLVNENYSSWTKEHIRQDGFFSNTLALSGVDDYVSITNSPSLQVTGDLTLSLWIRPDAIGPSRCNLIDKSYGGEYSLVLEPLGALTFYQGKERVSGSYLGTTVLSGGLVSGEWQHIVVTRDITTRELKTYVDGELKKEVTYASSSNYEPFAATTYPVKIGAGYLSAKFDGCIDQVLIYCKALSEEDIQMLYYNLLSVYPDQSYYTTENPVIVCDVDMTLAELQSSPSCYLIAKDSQGNTLDSDYNPNAGINTLEISNSAMSTGTNVITVELCRSMTDLVFRATTDVIKKTSLSSGTEVKVNQQNGYILKDGTPFFPIGLYPQLTYAGTHDFQAASTGGFNTYIHWRLYDDPDDAASYLTDADTYGLNVIEFHGAYSTDWLIPSLYPDFFNQYDSTDNKGQMIDAVSNVKAKDNLLCYYSFDEPRESQITAGQDLYASVNSEDGYHPTFVIHPNFIADDENYTNWSDIIGIDCYWKPPRASGDFYSSVDKIVKYAYLAKQRARQEHKPFWMTLMTQFGSLANKRAILPAEQRCQTYVALVSGAKGVFYWFWPILHEDVWDEICDLNDEMDTLAPSLLTPDLDVPITYSNGNFDPANDEFADVIVSLHKAPASASYDYVLLAVNTQQYPVDVDFDISLLGSSGTVSRLFSTSTYTVSSGEFSDQIEELGTRAYTFTSSSTDPITVELDLTERTDLAPTAEAAPYPISGRTGTTNMMQNPSLEDNTLTNWPDYSWPLHCASPRINATNQCWGLVTTNPYHGSKCLKIVKDGTLHNGVEFKLSPEHTDSNGKDYTFSAYIKADAANLNVRIGFMSAVNGTTYNTIYPTTSWARYTYTVNLPAKDADQYEKFSVKLFSTGTIYVDAVQLEESSSATTFTVD